MGVDNIIDASTQNKAETDHEELAEGDMGEDVVSLVLAAGEARLLPKM